MQMELCETSGDVIADPTELNEGTWPGVCPVCEADLILDGTGIVPDHESPQPPYTAAPPDENWWDDRTAQTSGL